MYPSLIKRSAHRNYATQQNGKFYRKDHSCIDIKTGYCGITQFAFDTQTKLGLVPMRYFHLLNKSIDIRRNELVSNF